MQYSEHILHLDRYRELVNVTSAFLQAIDRDSANDSWCQLAAFNGRGLRMTGKCTDSLKVLRDFLATVDASFARKKRAAVWLDVALAEQSLGNDQAAIDAAEEVKRHTDEHDGYHLQAMSIQAQLQFDGTERLTRLVELEKKAHEGGHKILATNIALDLAKETEELSQKLLILARVENESTPYNQSRVIVAKAKALQKQGSKRILGPNEIHELLRAYSYLYAQRIENLFDSCHDALWGHFESTGNVATFNSFI